MATDSYDESSLNPAMLVPKRSQNLIARIAGAVFRATPQYGPQPAQQNTTQSGIVAQALQSVYDQYFRSQNDRLAIYKDCDEMDTAAEEVSVALDTITNNVTSSEDGEQTSFDIDCEDAGVKAILDQVVEDCDLHEKIRPWTRNTIKYGDGFAEIVVNAEAQVVDIRQLPPSTMWRNVDVRGNLIIGEPRYDPSGQCLNKQRECAYEQRAEDTQEVVAAFWPFQIVHTRLNHDGYKAYGRSLLRVTRIIWKKLKAMEEALIIARLTRAWPQKRYFIDTTGMSQSQKKQALQTFKDSITVRQAVDGSRENPVWVGSDIYIADSFTRMGNETKESRTRVEDYDPKISGISAIDDYQYLHRKLLATLRVPPAYLGFEQDVNSKATVTNQDAEYIRFLRDVQQLMSQAMKQVFGVALILAGYDPAEVEYEIRWPRTSAADEVAGAQSEFWRAQADEIYAAAGVIDTEWMQSSRYGLDDEQIAEINQRVQQKQAEQQKQQAELAKQQAALKPPAMNGGGNGNSNGSPNKAAAVDGNGSGKPVAIRQDLSIVAENARLRTMELLRPDLNRVATQQAEALAQARELTLGQQRRSPEAPPVVNVTIAEGAVQVSNPITVQPAPVSVAAATPAPVTVNVPQQKPPIVNVAPSQVNVAAPSVSVKPPDVRVTVQQPSPAELQIERDRDGNIKSVRRKIDKGN